MERSSACQSLDLHYLPIQYTALLYNIYPQTTEQSKQPVCPSKAQLYDLLLSEPFSTPAVFVSVNNPYHRIGRRDGRSPTDWLSPAVIRRLSCWRQGEHKSLTAGLTLPWSTANPNFGIPNTPELLALMS